MNPIDIIATIDAYAARTGMKPSTICQLALGNARFYDRAKRRLEKYEDEAERIHRFIEKADAAAGHHPGLESKSCAGGSDADSEAA